MTMGFPLNDLGTALTGQIYQTVMGGDGTVKPPDDTFFTWTMPGIVYGRRPQQVRGRAGSGTDRLHH
jgi:hypothetical protein